jgi:hypothetical protein
VPADDRDRIRGALLGLAVGVGGGAFMVRELPQPSEPILQRLGTQLT